MPNRREDPGTLNTPSYGISSVGIPETRSDGRVESSSGASGIKRNHAVIPHVKAPEGQYPELARYPTLPLLLATWLAGVFVAACVARLIAPDGSMLGNVIYAIAIVWPASLLVGTSLRTIPTRMAIGTGVCVAIFALFGLGSVVVSPDPYVSGIYLGLSLVAIWIVVRLNSGLHPDQYRAALAAYAILMVPLLAVIAVVLYKPGVRLAHDTDLLGPNAIALVAMSVFLSATAVSNRVLQAAAIVVAAVVIYLTGSRSAAVAAVCGLSVILLFRISKMTPAKLAAMAVAVLALAPLLYVFQNELYAPVEKYLAIHDEYRGLGTGATGRTIVWHEAWTMFVENPVTGVGFRTHEQLLQRGSSSHNGYLALLAEIGLVGALAVFFLIVRGGLRLWSLTLIDPPCRGFQILTGLAFAYLLVAIFERYLINVGNPTSLLFLVAILVPPQGLRNSQQTGADAKHAKNPTT